MTMTHSILTPHTVTVGTTVIGGVSQIGVPANVVVGGEGADGQLYDSLKYINSIGPRPTFTTRNLGTAIAAIGATGVDLAATSPAKALALFFQKMLQGGSVALSGHRSFTFNKGILVPRSLSIGHRSEGSMVFEALPVSADGLNSSLARSDSATLPTITVALEREAYKLGAVKLGNVTYETPQNLEINWNWELASQGAGSNLYDELCFQVTCKPVITVDGLDTEAIGSAGVDLTGVSGTHANTLIRLRKCEHGGSFVTGGVGDILITAAGLVYPANYVTGTLRKFAENGLAMECTWDGTNAPLVFSVAT